ncbi:unnamed protein product [Mytilus coruscus]|uniref:Peptidase A2 domain-containing protein n=1 Tax=Mytilus coruscus TaxID=42192 RepID=A0A6J8F3J2_MYTCO|nr:unnamed protein product [Mytilus coruscus]
MTRHALYTVYCQSPLNSYKSTWIIYIFMPAAKYLNRQCPANGKSCNACNKLNHFPNVCRGKQNRNTGTKRQNTKEQNINEVKTEQLRYQESLDSSDEVYPYSIKEAETVCSIKKSPYATIKVNTKTCINMIDTGATVNILDDKTHQNIEYSDTRG